MKILRTKPDPSPDASGPPTYVTGDTHWWDGSQVYGGKLDFADGLRSHEKGRLRIDDLGLPPEDLQKFADLSGVAGNFWVGLAMLHSLFMREHNADLRAARRGYPGDVRPGALRQGAARERGADGQDPHGRLDAGDHRPPDHRARRCAPTGTGCSGEHFTSCSGSVTDDEVLHGIPGSQTNHHGVPYSLTEEFVAVYRMHPLIPDDFAFRSVDDDRVLAEHDAARAGRARRCASGWPRCRWPTSSTRSAARTPARSRCTTIPKLPPALRPRRRRR